MKRSVLQDVAGDMVVSRSWAAWLTAIVIGLAGLVYGRFAVIEPGRDWDQSDLAINYSAAKVLSAGGSIYEAAALRAAHTQFIGEPGVLFQALFLTYNNPPTTALLMWPLAQLPFSAARWGLVLINNAAYLLAIALLLKHLSASRPALAVCGLLGLLVFYFPIRQSFGLGQINGVIALLLATAVMAAGRSRDSWAGALIALAAAIKISPALLLGYFVVQRRWRVWPGVLATLIGLGVATLIAVGPATVWQFVAEVLPEVGRGSAAYPNQSLLGALYRFWVPPSAMQTAGAMGDYPLPRAVWLAGSIGLAAITLRATGRVRLEGRSEQAVALSSYIVLAMLIGNIAWDHYALWLIVPVVALVVDWFQTRRPAGWMFWPVFCAAVLAINLPVPIQASLGAALGPIGTSLTTWGTLLLWGVMMARLWRRSGRGCVTADHLAG